MNIDKIVEKILKDCLDVKSRENILVVTDTEKENIGKAIFKKAIQMGLETTLIIIKPMGRHGKEPPEAVSEAMKMCNVVICPTKFSLTHTQARKIACEYGARVVTMPGITEDMFLKGAMTADYKKVASFTDKLTEILTTAKKARIEKNGAILEMSLKNRKGISSNGQYFKPGSHGNLPTGEAYIAPVEGTANGRIIIDGSIANIGLVKAPLEVKIANGYAVDFAGPDADRLREILGTKKEARNIAELGIGTNPQARLIGNILEDEKIYGTVHIAFGDNSTFGGYTRAGVHIDGIILNPVLYIDDKLIVKEGKILI